MAPVAVNPAILIVGGGIAGLSAALDAANTGYDVTLVEKSAKLGGDCLHTGCVPSKTLIHTARVAWLMAKKIMNMATGTAKAKLSPIKTK